MSNYEDEALKVESPKAYGQDPLTVYVPKATTDTPGVVQPDAEQFTFENGKLRLKSGIGGGSGGVVDSTLSDTSENAVQNKVISAELKRISSKEFLTEKIGEATNLNSGLMSASDKSSLSYLSANINKLINDATSRENLTNIIGSVTLSNSGLMSPEDKSKLDILINILGTEVGDSDSFVNTIREILKVFEQYDEGHNLSTILSKKLEEWQVRQMITERIDSEMSATSTNAVQNKVVKSYIESYVAASGGGSSGGSSEGKSLQTVCSTRLGWFSSMEDRASVFTATMGYDLSQNENCVVIVDGVSKTVSLVNGVGTFGTVAVATSGTGITATISVEGRYVKMTNMMYEHGASVPEDTYFSDNVFCNVIVKTLTDGDFNVCTDYVLLRDTGETHTFTLDKPLTDGCTIQLKLNGSYENLTYPQSIDYGLYYNYNSWTIRDDGPNTICVSTDWAESSLTLSIDVTYGSSSNSGGSSGGSSSGSSKRHNFYKIYPYSSKDVLALDASKTYCVIVYSGSYSSADIRTVYIYKNGWIDMISGYQGMTSLYEYMGNLVFSADSSDDAEYYLVDAFELDEYDITCFIEGTNILLRDPITLELYSKKIEDVQHFDYAAYWKPDLGRLTATRIIAPPIVGECTEWDRLYFSDGRELDVYGVQFFWHADLDKLVDWRTLSPDDRVCTFEGDLVHFVRSEHIVSSVPKKHYTLMPFMGKYIANGIQVGDKRELFYPRMLQPERLKYWNKLAEVDQKHLIRVYNQGMARRNWKSSEEYRTATLPIRKEIAEAEKLIADRIQYLNDTDYLVSKLAEGCISEEEFSPIRIARQEARDLINAQRLRLAELNAALKTVTNEIRDKILGTHVPKYKGKFIGKDKAIL